MKQLSALNALSVVRNKSSDPRVATTANYSIARRTILPPPRGEGRGEGKETVQSFANRNVTGLLRRGARAFTLIEMLVVIAIIAILAGLIVGLAPAAISRMRIARVQAERDALVTLIETYKKAKGSYPPDNTNSPYINTLFYELTGAAAVNAGGNISYTMVNGEHWTGAALQSLFNSGGINNSSADPTEVRNFFGPALKADKYASFNYKSTGGTYTVLGLRVPGSPMLTANIQNAAYLTPWNYVATNPTNNQNEFDLWMDVQYGGKTNRISNWSKDPQPLP